MLNDVFSDISNLGDYALKICRYDSKTGPAHYS